MAKPFQKGTDPRRNLKGRPKGSPNKSTDQLRDMVAGIISDNWHQFTRDIITLDPDKRVMLMDRLLKHVLPPPQDPIARLSMEDVEIIILELKKRYNGN